MSEHAHDYLDAASEEIVHALRHYGVLTKDRLAEMVAAKGWHMRHFESALERVVEAGRVRRLTPDLYEIAEQEKIFFRDE